MNILVINGSPKGKNSITLQTVNYLALTHPALTFRCLNAGQTIRSLEKDFSKALEDIAWADCLLFAYPVYTFIAPSQLHRFIELMKMHGAQVRGKYATQITTSKHFYDVTAHRYIQDNCHDMGMRFVRGLSADMDDLLREKGQKEADAFLDGVLFQMKHGFCEPCLNLTQETPLHPVTVPGVACMDKPGDVVVVTDLAPEDAQLSAMIARFCAVLPLAVRVVNLRDFPFSGGCLGCFNCAADGVCVYKDGFDRFLREQLQSAQSIVYAFSIRDHSMGSLFKLYDDRQFCNGHRTVTMGMPIGYLVSGHYAQETNLQMILEARAQVGGNPLCGVAADESDPDAQIDRMAASLAYALETGYAQPQNFWGVGGMKIFRDLIYQMRGMMRADHKFYKAHGQYDFPQKKVGTILGMYAVGAMLASPRLRAKMGNKMTEGMLMPYRKVLTKLKQQNPQAK